MKRTAIILSSVALFCSSAIAQPILVGHRGSGYGLENSEESFKRGIELGYKYLETDVKFCKGDILVCTHDDDTKRLGGTKDIKTSTLDELQSETLSQTRSGVKYTGRICSMKEYLQICKDGGVGPLIELKWTDGINSNDCSKIPLLIEQIEEVGMRDKCIILTSMKPCLEYIRTNYPDIPLQFLTGQYWANHFDWCVQWGIDVDIQSGYFDKSTVQKFHDKGLKVNMWTTNDAAGYKTYGNMGCDYITTDRLDASSLPELNPDVTFPPNTVDYPNTAFTPDVKGKYDVTEQALDAWPAEFEGGKVLRAARGVQGWYVLLEKDAAQSLWFVADGTSEPRAVSMEGIEGGEKLLGNIAVTADGKLVGCNIEVVTNNEETTKPWKTYIWDGPDAAPAALISTDRFDQTGNWVSGRIGETLAVSGRSNDLKIYTSSYSASSSSPTYRVCGFKVEKGVLAATTYALDANAYTPANWGDFDFTVTPTSRDNLLVAPASNFVHEYTFQWEGTRIPMDSYAEGGFDVLSRVDGISYTRYGSKVYALVPSGRSGVAALDATVYDVTDGIASPKAVTDLVNVCDLNAPGAVASAFEVNGEGDTRLYVFVEGEGFWSAAFDKYTVETKEPVDLGLVLERQWINSVSTDNAPEHIHGTNAQQGTAVDGLFYVNDCVDAKIYIFDQSGCLGSIPGGKGWGCARDDRGNIIVRDDKLTGATHNFIVYPAGATPDQYGEPVTFEIEFTLEGQTNFINASGDLLGEEGGYIYLFPNKQNQVAIAAVKNGQPGETYTSGELKFAGSTAGYVIPMDNNRENWLYQVRANGIVEYKGGVSEDVVTTRATTAQPGRNSTGGGALITIGANRVVLHNSGANYVGGFTVRDITMDKVIDNVAPIGNKGYAEGGNYSTFNWLYYERRGDLDYTIYQYCPANGMAVYRLYNPEADCVKGINGAECNIFVNGTEVVANGARSIAIYDLTGKMLINVEGEKADMAPLAKGVYVIKTSDGASMKVLR